MPCMHAGAGGASAGLATCSLHSCTRILVMQSPLPAGVLSRARGLFSTCPLLLPQPGTAEPQTSPLHPPTWKWSRHTTSAQNLSPPTPPTNLELFRQGTAQRTPLPPFHRPTHPPTHLEVVQAHHPLAPRGHSLRFFIQLPIPFSTQQPPVPVDHTAGGGLPSLNNVQPRDQGIGIGTPDAGAMEPAGPRSGWGSGRRLRWAGCLGLEVGREIGVYSGGMLAPVQAPQMQHCVGV